MARTLLGIWTIKQSKHDPCSQKTYNLLVLRKLKINIYLYILTSSVKQKHGVQEKIKKDHIVYVGGVEGVKIIQSWPW